MLRWLALCVALVIGCVTLFAIFSPKIGSQTPPRQSNGGGGRVAPGPSEGGGGEEATADRPAGTAPALEFEPKVFAVRGGKAGAPDLIVQEARVLSMEKQEVPAERDGKLICLATPVLEGEGEQVREDKKVTVELSLLFVPVGDARDVELEKQRLQKENNQRHEDWQFVTFPDAPNKYYRYARENEALPPQQCRVELRQLHLRKLEVGEHVAKDQMLALVNPVLAIDDMKIKHAKLDAAEADRRASLATWREAKRRLESIDKANRETPRAVSADERGQADLAVKKYYEEEIAKAGQVKVSQRELSAALTTVKQHLIRAAIPGVVKVVYKYSGDSVKNLEPVLQIQNLGKLRVEGQVELQDAKYLRDRLAAARDLKAKGFKRWEAARLRNDKRDEAEGQKMMGEADARLRVVLEVSRPEPPQAVLKGHRLEVTCVAVGTRQGQPWIVSGSEDKTVRLWERPNPKEPRWQEKYLLLHDAVVRAVACTPAKAALNRVLTGTANGKGRLFNLDKPDEEPTKLGSRHSGAITSAAFSPDGKWCATGGEDRAICLWATETGKLLHRITDAHKAPVTSVQFASATRLVSAGDKRLLVWAVDEEKAPEHAGEAEGRSGDVGQLGLSPDGKRVLFDEGRELRVQSLDNGTIEGKIQNPVGAVNFSTMAIFSPDGQTILTNGDAAGRLQLWRAPAGKDVRAAELRQYMWSSGVVTCGAFAPDATFAVSGTRDHQVLVWEMPSEAESKKQVTGQLTYVEEFLDSSLKRVPVRAEIVDAPSWVKPGANTTLVIPSLGGR